MKGKRRYSKTKAVTAKDREWSERKVAELKAELEKLPPNRQEELRRELETEPEEGEPGTEEA